MNPEDATAIIELVGGTAAFAKLLGPGRDGKDYSQQRVNNWKWRGIPPEVVLAHYDTFRRLKRRLTDFRADCA